MNADANPAPANTQPTHTADTDTNPVSANTQTIPAANADAEPVSTNNETAQTTQAANTANTDAEPLSSDTKTTQTTQAASTGLKAAESAGAARLRAEWEKSLLHFEEAQHVSGARRVLRRMRHNRLLLFGSALGLLVFGAGVLGPWLIGWLTGNDHTSQNFSTIHLPPFSDGHLLGTDGLGRDLAARTFVGIRVSLVVAAGVTVLALAAGIVLGMLSGYLRGWTDRVIGGSVDFIWGFPLILLAVLFAGGIGEGLVPVILAVGLVNTAAIARVVRGEVLTLSQREFVEAARAGGYSAMRIMWRHIFPNILAPAFVLASYYVAVAVIAEAALSFIGLGAQPPTPSLGQLVSDGRNFLRLNHWEATIPGIAIVLLVLSVSLIGDGLRDVFDPRLRHEAKTVDQS